MFLQRFSSVFRIQSMTCHFASAPQQKQFNFEKYQKTAKSYYYRNPRDEDKTLEACWLGFAYNMKKCFLEMGYDIPVDKSIFKFSKIVAFSPQDNKEAIELIHEVHDAENFFENHYSMYDDYDYEFKERMKTVFHFTDTLSKMDNTMLKQGTEKLIKKIKNNEETKLNVEEVPAGEAVVQLGKNFYRITHKFY